MTGELFIDQIDAFVQWTIGVQDESYTGLVQFPALRTPPMNDFPDSNGIEVDLSDPKLHNKVFSITFNAGRDKAIREFIDYLDEEQYHTFEFRNIGLTKQLRLNKFPNRNTVNDSKVFTLEFADDGYPFTNYTRPSLIQVPRANQAGISIDDINLSDYGIWYTGEERDEILITGDIKPALTIDEQSLNSILYDSEEDVRYKSRDITIQMALWADKNTFWNNWNAFFYDLIQPGLRSFYYEIRGDFYDIFYKSCNVNRFQQLPNNELYCNFAVTFTFINMELTGEWRLLATEPYGILMLDGTDTMIDTSLKPLRNPS